MSVTQVAGLTIRAIEPHELDAYGATLRSVFALSPEDTHVERLRALIDPQRTYCAFDGADLVATAGTFAFHLAIPGGVVPMAGLTNVAVRPTYRRRGILRAVVRAHLADARDHGEPVSGLWASEAAIYGRFGYGVAAEGDHVAIVPRPGFAAGRTLDAVAELSLADAARVLPPIHAAALPTRPGMFSRSEAWWHHRTLADRPDQRGGHGALVAVISRRGGEPTGYVLFRQKLAFEQGRAAGTIDVAELVAVDGTAEATLWRYLQGIDLFPNVEYGNAPTDALVTWLAADRSSIARQHRDDTLWLRIGDVPAMLGARGYAADGVLRLEVIDPFGAEGPGASTYQLVVEGGAGRCETTAQAPELSLELPALASIYLGGVAPSVLARAGLIRGAPAAIARADRLFAWPVAPWCPEMF